MQYLNNGSGIYWWYLGQRAKQPLKTTRAPNNDPN
jgi:hypothetical protein